RRSVGRRGGGIGEGVQPPAAVGPGMVAEVDGVRIAHADHSFGREAFTDRRAGSGLTSPSRPVTRRPTSQMLCQATAGFSIADGRRVSPAGLVRRRWDPALSGALWIHLWCGGENVFGVCIPVLSGVVPPWLVVVVHNCCVLCRLSGCLDKIVVSVGRRSSPLTTNEGRDRSRGSEGGGVVMSTVVAACPPFDGDDREGQDGWDGLGEVAAEAFLASLPRHLREVRARRELTREDLPRRGGSVEEPQLSAATQRVWDAQVQEARALAEKYRALAELYRHDGEYEEVAELDSVDTTRAALALRVTGGAAGWQLRDGYQAVHLFPRCLAALEAGDMASA